MLRNYLITAIRNLWRNKLFAFLNIFGLAIGVAVAIMLLLWVQNELSYDNFHQKSDNLYRVVWTDPSGVIVQEPRTDAHIGQVLKNSYPDQIDQSAIYIDYPDLEVYQNKEVNTCHAAFVESAILNMFTFEFISGNPAEALKNPKSIVLTKSMALKYFGNENPIGKTLDVKPNLIITGVIEDFPHNSHLNFDCLIPFDSYKKLYAPWDIQGMSAYYTFLLLNDGVLIENLNQTIAERPIYFGWNIFLQSLTDIYLHSEAEQPIIEYGNIKLVYIFSSLAIFLLLMACINFMNLSTAYYSRRAREVGLRKVVGAQRKQLILQFYSETFIVILISFILALTMVEIYRPFFSNICGKELIINYNNNNIIIILSLVLISTTLLSGLYPSLFLSSFRPIKVFKSSFNFTSSKFSIRSVLVVFQFAISIMLICIAFAVNSQVDFILNKDTGFKKENIIKVPLMGDYNEFKTEIDNSPYIKEICGSDAHPGNIGGRFTYYWQGEDSVHYVTTSHTNIDYNFIKFFGLELTRGRNFSEKIVTDLDSAMIVNETTLKMGGIENIENFNARYFEEETRKITNLSIIGTVKDFQFRSFYTNPRALALWTNGSPKNAFIKLNGNNMSNGLNAIEKTFNKLYPGYTFQYSLIEDEMLAMYSKELQLSAIVKSLMILAILISCLGTFGLASFMAARRRKEIGIRKTLGLSVIGIIRLLSKDFLGLILVAFVIACPIAWYAIEQWLQEFAFRTDVHIFWFAFAGIVSAVIAQLTVFYQAWKAARANPVDALKYE